MMNREAFNLRLIELGKRLVADRFDPMPIVALGHRLAVEDEADLVVFRERVIRNPDRLLHQWMGQTALRRRRMNPDRRRMLDVLGRSPDLFEPSGSRWDERLHTATLTWFLGWSVSIRGGLAFPARDAFLTMICAGEPEQGHPLPDVEELRAQSWRVVAERSVAPFGRVDIWLESTKFVVVVEAKLGAREGIDQIKRYNDAKVGHARGREWIVVFLTVDNALAASGPSIRTTFRDLLSAWLPLAVARDTGTHEHMALYLATVAIVCGVAGAGDFDDWNLESRRSALDLVEAK